MDKKCRILLVDDEKDIVTVIKKGLEKHGFEVDGCTSPMEALTKFKIGIHDLLILDIRMPGMSGIQLFRKIKEMDEKIRVLFLTAFEIEEDEWRLVLPNVDANGFVKKPARLEDLVSTIYQIKTARAQ
jgi:two-component system catabolic regulation response regulator CreB